MLRFKGRLRKQGEELQVPKAKKISPINVGELPLCVGGRLQKLPIDQEAKHPTIFPKDHHVSDLIIRHYHSGNEPLFR